MLHILTRSWLLCNPRAGQNMFAQCFLLKKAEKAEQSEKARKIEAKFNKKRVVPVCTQMQVKSLSRPANRVQSTRVLVKIHNTFEHYTFQH